MNLIDVAKQFATPEACNDFLEQMRWPMASSASTATASAYRST